ncbi:hypothetical protein OV207_08395 [Corallococcus sp. BB11-1]|uniref:hypothetical protein n=1 Tax=Corallococcus sp. BB11-1 TaxID=2996783 RepID=UPI00226FBD29|nr:hypothetical protein [Corallococcus sp. BB11-1]MCY1031472.1 hypothetical protein [Corallococcus sp. BB11-1]
MNRAPLLSACLLATCLACTEAPRAPAEPSAPTTPSRPTPPPAPAEPDAGALVDAGATTDAGTTTAATCSARDLSPVPKPTAKPLPPAVASMRERIIAAAVACDYAALQKLGDEKGKAVRFSYDPDQDMATTWRIQEEWAESPQPVLSRLVQVLNLPFYQEGNLIYWPTAFREGATAADYRALKGLYPDDQLQAMRKDKSYLGLRVGITVDGDWQLAVAGD